MAEVLAVPSRHQQCQVLLQENLTDAERDAIGDMIHLIECQHEDYGKEAATLRSLLARLAVE